MILTIAFAVLAAIDVRETREGPEDAESATVVMAGLPATTANRCDLATVLTALREADELLKPDAGIVMLDYVPPSQMLREQADRMDRENATKARIRAVLAACEPKP